MSTSATALSRRSTCGVGADHLDLEAGHAALADLVERVGDAVHRRRSPSATSATRSGSPSRVASLRLLAAEEGGRGRVGDRGDAGVEEARPRPRRGRRRRSWRPGRRRPRSRACARGARRARRKRSAWQKSVVLQEREQLALAEAQVDGVEPGAQQGAGVVGAEVGSRSRRARASPSRHHALDHASGRRAGRARPRRRRGPARGRPAPSRACAHLAALPCSPRAAARPARTWREELVPGRGRAASR